MVTFIGDVHGKYKQYKKILRRYRNTIQVGDLGVGFRYRGQSAHRYGKWIQNPPHYLMKETSARFIRGNHDCPTVCRNHSQWIRDGQVEVIDGRKFMFIGGALSVDKAHRMEGFDWWADEELSINQFYSLMDIYEQAKPDIMVTHDCPESIAQEYMIKFRQEKGQFDSITRQALQSMFEIHQPAIWIYGHWHHSIDQLANNTRFICLAELEVKEI